MPPKQDLSDDLKGLADINALEFLDSWWDEGVVRLIAQIEKSLEDSDKHAVSALKRLPAQRRASAL